MTFASIRLRAAVLRFLFPDTASSHQDLTSINSGNKVKPEAYQEDWLQKAPLLFVSSFPELREELERALDPCHGVLSEIQSRRIESHFFEGKTIAEIAEEEGRSVMSIRNSIHGGMLNLNRYLLRNEFVRPNTSRFDFKGLFRLP